MDIEFCIDSLAGAKAARKYVVKRVELCTALESGGLTPSFGLINKCAQYHPGVHVMIRNRPGDFCFSPEDMDVMAADVEMAARAGAEGVVIGALTPQKDIDIDILTPMVDMAKKLDLEVTFHRAFDMVKNPLIALDTLIESGIDRLLTSGQKPTAIEGIDLIKELVRCANGKIQIMAGSGVSLQNALTLKNAGVDALHFTVHPKNQRESFPGMGTKPTIDHKKINDILGALHINDHNTH